MPHTDNNNLATSWLLRLGLASVYLYAGIDSLREPAAWIGFLPAPALHLLPTQYLLLGFSSFQIVLALALLWRKTAAYAALVSTVTLVAIVATNLSTLLITFRDFGLIFMSIALVTHDWNFRLTRRRKRLFS